VGFIFSKDYDGSWSAAEYVREEGDWLLLNPYRDGSPESGLFSISDDDDLDRLYAYAIHECTHLASNVAYHDEDFATAFTRNLALAIRGRRNIRAIRQAVSQFYKGKAAPKAKRKGKTVSKGDLRYGESYYVFKRVGRRGRPTLYQDLSELVKRSNREPNELIEVTLCKMFNEAICSPPYLYRYGGEWVMLVAEDLSNINVDEDLRVLHLSLSEVESELEESWKHQ